MPPDMQPLMIALLIAIPIGLILFLFLLPFLPLLPPFFQGLPESSEDSNRPLIQDRKEFLKAQPFFCDECKTFTDLLKEYCENCGAKDSLRKAIKNDFKFYIKRIREDSNP